MSIDLASALDLTTLDSMDQRVDFITLATPDLSVVRGFYLEGLGWNPLLDVPDEIIFFQIGRGLVLGFFDASAFAADIGLPTTPASLSGVTLSHNVESPAQVDAVITDAKRVGATIVKPPQRAAFGGHHAHFADPNGVVWEVAHNPGWSVDDSGKVILGPAG